MNQQNKINHQNKKRVNRGKGKKEVSLVMFSNNAAGLTNASKKYCLKSEIKNTNAAIFTIQETCLKKKGKFTVKNYEIFEAIRKGEKKGTMIGIHNTLKPVVIAEYSDEIELLVVEMTVSGKEIRVISGVGPHENQIEAERLPFFLTLEKEINKAENEGKSIVIEIDANSKLGKERIPNSKHDISPNGRLLAGIVDRHALVVVNGSTKCTGTITRKRITVDSVEESAIDVVMVSTDLNENVVKLVVDEERKHALTKLVKNKNKVESDHNPLITTFSWNWNKANQIQTTKVFNLKNKKCQEKFKKETTNNSYLSSAFDDEDGNIKVQVDTFLKRLEKTLHKCFRKIKVKEKVDKETESLYNRWRQLQAKSDDESNREIKEVEDKLAEMIEKNFRTIQTETGEIDCAEESGFHSGRMWKLKKKLCPRAQDPPTAMVDDEGNLVTSAERIQELALKKLAVERLRNREMKDNLKEMRKTKEKLCELNLLKAKNNKTPDWTKEEVKEALKGLKQGVSRDPSNLANEIFHPDVAGNDFVLAITKLMNKMKKDQVFPQQFQSCNITSIWKSKGPKNTFDSYRGVFRVSVFRSILDRLIYNDEYHNIDANLTDCNVGSRKNRNIRDHIFVMNAVLNTILEGDEEALDFQAYDVEQTFDSLWLDEVVNELFEAGFNNDKLNLLFLENSSAHVAVKTSSGISRREVIRKLIMQGTIWGGLCCTVLIDKLGKFVYSRPELMHLYKGQVPVPPLQMVDDVLCISNCSPQSVQVNSVINSFMECKKLTLNHKKCHNVHIGKYQKCPQLKVHNENMKQSEKVKYLGDQLDKSGKAKATIEDRKAKGFGIVSDISAITDDIPLGPWRIQAALMLRQAMLVNGTMFNSECWQGKTVSTDIKVLNKPDQALHRALVDGHSKTPLEFLHLELGTVPLHIIHKGRRANYHQSILKSNTDELVNKIYRAQQSDSRSGDFCELISQDLEFLDIHMNENAIASSGTKQYKTFIKTKVQNAAFKFLVEEQQHHSKVKHINYNELKIQPYLSSPIFSRKEKSTLFRLRSRTIPGIRSDFGDMFGGDKFCPVCPQDVHLDSIPALLACPTILAECKNEPIQPIDTKYDDIFSSDVTKQHNITKWFIKLLDIREKLLSQDNPPEA